MELSNYWIHRTEVSDSLFLFMFIFYIFYFSDDRLRAFLDEKTNLLKEVSFISMNDEFYRYFDNQVKNNDI